MADNAKQRHPPTTYKTEYPYNRVMVTESGHELHWDDTPGKERVRIAHKTGTYMEMNEEGRRVDLTTAHHVVYAKGGMTTTSDKNVDLKVAGSGRSNYSGDTHEEVKGTSSYAIGSDHKSVIGGDHVSATKGDSAHGVVGKYSLKVGSTYLLKVDESGEMNITGDLSIASLGTITLKAPSIVLDSPSIKLGSAGASRALALLGSIDSSGDVEESNLATKVYGE